MLLKRKYDIPEGWEPARAPDGTLTNPLPVTTLEVKHTGTHPEQNFSRRLVDAGLAEGWLSMRKGKLTLHTEQGDLEYTVRRMPGTYCCHCGARLSDDTTGEMNRAHVAEVHEGKASPDLSNPAGYMRTNAYECMLDAAQHEQWKVPENAKVSLWRGKKE